jgi:hypothetical protein
MKHIFLTILFTFITQSGFAHGDHHEMQKDEANQKAKAQVEQLVTEAKLPATWKSATIVSSETKSIGGKKRWVIALDNPQELDISKKKLEVVFKPSGKFVIHQFSK